MVSLFWFGVGCCVSLMAGAAIGAVTILFLVGSAERDERYDWLAQCQECPGLRWKEGG